MTTPRPVADLSVPERARRSVRVPAMRTPVRVAAAVLTTGLVLTAGPALADVPSGWPDPPSIPLLDGLFVYVVAPATLFLLVVLLSLAPALARGERIGAGRPSRDQWFGGRRSETAELESGTPAPGTGGASGRW